MSHIRSLSAGRSVSRMERSADGVSLALTSLGTPLLDLLADLNSALSQFVYRKKFEPV